MIGLDLLAAHMVGDYILQTDDMAKRKLTDPVVRSMHCLLYTLAFVPVALWHGWGAGGPPWAPSTFLLLVFVTHHITDSRRWASGEKWPPKPILVDQTIHLVTLAVLARLLVP